jgi:hypothetical protein
VSRAGPRLSERVCKNGRHFRGLCLRRRDGKVAAGFPGWLLRGHPGQGQGERNVQPRPKLGRWTVELDELLTSNAAKPTREQLTLIRIFEQLRERGYEGGYDAVRRYARRWGMHRHRYTT